MNILTILTKRSVREPSKEKKFLKFYSAKKFQPGNMIEIIHGNKKIPSIVLKIESALNYKEEVRSGNLEIKKLKLSKTGKNKEGEVFDNFQISEIKQYLKNPKEAKKSENKNIKSFFPRIQESKETSVFSTSFSKAESKEKTSHISELITSKIFERKKTYNSPMQELVDNIRKYFYENARYGFGSFSYYIGMFKQLPLRDVNQIFAEVKQIKKRNFEKKKIF